MAFDVSPSSLLAYRAAVVADLKSKLPPTVRVEKHDGYFDEETVERFAINAPAVYVAVLGAKPYSGAGHQIRTHTGDGRQLFQLQAVCFVIATNEGGTDASDIAMAIAELIACEAAQNTFGSDKTLTAENVSIENLWSNKTDRRGICLNSVHWMCDIAIGADYAALENLLPGASPGDTIPPGATVTVNETINGDASSSPPLDESQP